MTTPSTATLPNWHSWIGLPHSFGASPESGIGCDCLVMVWQILDAAGVPHPPLDSAWNRLAAEGRWIELERLWHRSTEPIPVPEPFSVVLFKNGPAGLGVGIVIDSGVLMVHHRKGVIWVPCRLLKLNYSRFCQ
jgi:cell wall-associated NlpC family hydrolase